MNELNDVSLRQAANWHARLHAPDCSAADREAFERWLESSPSCRAAYAQVQAAAQRAEAVVKTDPRLRAMALEALRDAAQPAGTSSSPEDASGGPPPTRCRR